VICQNKEYVDFLLKVAISQNDLSRDVGILVSGKFGKWFVDNYKNEIKNHITQLPGGLRMGRSTKDGDMYMINYNHSMIYPKYYLFLDDSFYSGITRAKCIEHLKMITGSIVTGSYVVYNGSPLDEQTCCIYDYYRSLEYGNGDIKSFIF